MVGDVSIAVMNTLGEVVFSSEERVTDTGFRKEIDLCKDAMHCVSPGIYFIEVKGSSHSRSRTILIIK
jgi:hypothetical protein